MADSRCPMCGAPNPDQGGACRYCGTKTSAAAPPPPPPQPPPQQPYQQPYQQAPPPYSPPQPYPYVPSHKDKTTAIILCVLGFIGLSGIHRFYVGKPLSGILYLLTFGWCWVGTIVDLVMLGAGTFKDGNGNPLM